MRTNLPKDVALEIYNYIRANEYTELKEKLDNTLKMHAKMRQGMCAMAMAWYGTAIPEAMQGWLTQRFGVEYLYNCNLLSAAGEWIELGVLSSGLPDELVDTFFHYDLEEAAREHGVTVEDAREKVVNAFVRYEDNEYGEREYYFRADNDDTNNLFGSLAMLGFGMMGRNNYDDPEAFVRGGGIGEKNLLKLLETKPEVFPEKFNFLKGTGANA